MERFIYLIINFSIWIIVVWTIVPIIIDDLTIDSIIARLGLGSACIANLFQFWYLLLVDYQYYTL